MGEGAIEIVDGARDDDVGELRGGGGGYKIERNRHDDGRSLSCFLRDADGQLRAGIDGFTWGGYAKVEYLWVDEGVRGRGLGWRLMAAAIEQASMRGCDVMVVDTHTFQAPGFYEKLGFTEVGRTEGTPRGWGQAYYARPLTPTPGGDAGVSDRRDEH